MTSKPLVWTIAWRYLRGQSRPGQGAHLLGGTARAALTATAIGVTAMVIAMALMTGYREELQRKLIGGNAAIVAYPLAAAENGGAPGAETLAKLGRLAGVEQVRPVAFGQGSLHSAAVAAGLQVTLRGVDPGGDLLGGGTVDFGSLTDGVPGAVLGSELLARLEARPGDVLRLVALGFREGVPRFSYQSLRVAGAFTTGFSEFDRAWVVVDRRLVERLMGRDGGASLYEFRLADPAQAPGIVGQIEALLGPRFLVSDWQDLNRELFTALRVQQLALFVVLGLIVLVSTFNVASTLVVLVRERMRDIGVLAAMGLSPGAVRAVFLIYGGILGLLGTAAGVAVGGAAAWALDRFELIRFDAEVAAIYFIRSVPFRVAVRDVLAVAGFAALVNLAACLAPAWRAARVDPSAALRYE